MSVAQPDASLDKTLESIMTTGKRLNQEQTQFLLHFVQRLKVEYFMKQQGEPLLDLAHGFPSTGASAVIVWMRRLMEDGLGWKHGVQFVCRAFQNAMAAQINGFTVHHLAGRSVLNDDGDACGDRHTQSMKCAIDEARQESRRRISHVADTR